MKALFDFILPRFCIVCGIPLLPSYEIICNNCITEFKPADNQRLSYEYDKKFGDKNIIKDFAAAYIFEKDKALQVLLHELKYNKKFRVGIYIGNKIGDLLLEKIKQWNPDFIVPVPLHSLKKTERGFNQSFYIAKGIRKATGFRIKNNLLKRVKFTETQTTLTFAERKNNISGAFKFRNIKQIKNTKVVLLDDVITTGATISECAKVLKDQGADVIYAMSVAIAD